MEFECYPALSVPIPRPPDVITTPVVFRAEGDDRYSKEGEPYIRQRRHLTTIFEAQVLAENPAAVVFPADIAPGFILETPMNV
jgi:hypothetical protein